jgi:hypothetical protein
MLKTQAAWLEESRRSRPVVRLLPYYDTLLLGYRSREVVLPPEHARRIFPGGGLLYPALIVDGRAAGRWKIERQRAAIDVMVEPFQDLSENVRHGLAAEVEDIGRFLAFDAKLSLAAPP